MVDPRARTIPGGAMRLEEIAQRLFSKPYLSLADEESRAVWDAVDTTEESE